MPRTKPPFRADMVGSLLRPSAIASARAAHGEQRLDEAGLREVEDREIRAIVRKQEDIGLQAVTDGEFRRSWWHFDFYRALDGCELREAEHVGQVRVRDRDAVEILGLDRHIDRAAQQRDPLVELLQVGLGHPERVQQVGLGLAVAGCDKCTNLFGPTKAGACKEDAPQPR